MPNLKQITIYPVKSIAGIDLLTSQVELSGLAFDRRFVLSDSQGQFITARTENKLCLIHSQILPDGLQLNAPGMPELIIKYQDFAVQYQTVKVWSDQINAQYCSALCDQWFSDYLNRPCQLVYFGELSTRKAWNTNNEVSFADGYPLLLISQASLDDLNTRSTSVINMTQFRPNVVVDHCEAFAEDGWKRIKIGEVVFDVYSPCARCVFTTINPLTAEPHQLREPLATLQKYRKDDKGALMFGQNIIPLNPGKINLDDPVTIIETKSQAVYVNNAPIINAGADQHKQQPKSFVLRCTKVTDETADVKTFEFQPYVAREISYKPGQHITIELVIEGKRINRCYTLSSSPIRPDMLSITVKRKEGGVVSQYLHNKVEVGSIMTANGIGGNFHLGKAKQAKLLLLSAGSGITPMLSMLRALADQGREQDIVFFHSAKNASDIVAKQELDGLANKLKNCQFIYTLTRTSQPYKRGYIGHITQSMLANITDLTQREVFFCGPEGLRQALKTMLLNLGLPASQFHFESFGVSALQPQSRSAIKNSKKLNITFSSWHTEYQGNDGQTLLEQAELAGVNLPYSCRAGVCGTCKVKVVQGEVTHLLDMGGLAEDERQLGYVLACNCIPQSNLIIEAD